MTSEDLIRLYSVECLAKDCDKSYEEWLEAKLIEEISENDKLYKDIEELIHKHV